MTSRMDSPPNAHPAAMHNEIVGQGAKTDSTSVGYSAATNSVQGQQLHNIPTIQEETSQDMSQIPTASEQHYKIRAAIGLPAKANIIDEHDRAPHQMLFWPRVRLVLREPFAEFWGTFILIMFGCGSVAEVTLSNGTSGNYQSISWGWGLGVMLGIYVAGDSGAYLNPAITLASCVFRGLPWRRFPMYLVAQVLGAYCAAGVVYANYVSAIDAYSGHGVRSVPPAVNSTAQVFCTYPQNFTNTTNQFFSEFIASTLLMFVIFALKDDSNSGGFRASGNWFPLCLFFLIFGLGACFGFETGYAINLARDFGPRLMTYCLGYGTEVWTAYDYYFWIPIVAPFAGCLFGGFLYDVFIYTGPESPINSPYMGLPHIFFPHKAIQQRWEEREDTDEPPAADKVANV